MDQALIYLCLAYAALGVLVLGLNIYSRWPLVVKLATILLVSGLYFVTWQALQGLQGWPTQDAMPQRFILLSTSVHEPNKTTGDAGVIQLWVTPIGPDDQPSRRPRAFAVPYSKDLHQEIAEAKRGMRNGILQLGTARAVKDPQQVRDSTRFARAVQKITFQDLPDPALPEK